MDDRWTLISKVRLFLSVTFNPHRPDLLLQFKSDRSFLLGTTVCELFIAAVACCILCQENRSIFDAHGPYWLATFLYTACPVKTPPTPHTHTTLSSHLICNITLYLLPVRTQTLSQLMESHASATPIRKTTWVLYVSVNCWWRGGEVDLSLVRQLQFTGGVAASRGDRRGNPFPSLPHHKVKVTKSLHQFTYFLSKSEMRISVSFLC